jgi:hypothetical protein
MSHCVADNVEGVGKDSDERYLAKVVGLDDGAPSVWIDL